MSKFSQGWQIAGFENTETFVDSLDKLLISYNYRGREIKMVSSMDWRVGREVFISKAKAEQFIDNSFKSSFKNIV